jgi:plasmid stability protein
MKATLDIPDEVVAELPRRAQRHGRELEEEIVQIVTVAILVEGTSDATVLSHVVRMIPTDGHRDASALPRQGATPVVSTDPATGLPVIHSPANAPIRSMSAEQIRALLEGTQLEEDLERAGLPVRH